jgi:hypothetical protein
MPMSIGEARAKLSELIAAVERGEGSSSRAAACRSPGSCRRRKAGRIGLAHGAVARCHGLLGPVPDDDVGLWE